MLPVKSVVICCAGVGSRLGLSKPKALLDIYGKPLIQWQLDLLKDVKDVRVVVGFQAEDVTNKVLAYREDAVIIYNNDYSNTKTGASYYIGAKDANEFVIELDGDLLIHPDDMNMLLNQEGEWLAYSEKMSDDAIMVNINRNGEVLNFSRQYGDYEWTGPCCVRKDRLQFSSEHVYNQLEQLLPMRGIKVRSCDIDTYDDYQRALEFIKDW